MSDLFTALIGGLMLVGVLWLFHLAGFMQKPPVDQEEDGEQSKRDVQHIVHPQGAAADCTGAGASHPLVPAPGHQPDTQKVRR